MTNQIDPFSADPLVAGLFVYNGPQTYDISLLTQENLAAHEGFWTQPTLTSPGLCYNLLPLRFRISSGPNKLFFFFQIHIF